MQVDASIAKGAQRISGSVLGCVYGFLVMLSPAVATNPYAVTALCCLSAFVCGLYAEHKFHYGAFLALYTSAVMMLAQVGSHLYFCCIEWWQQQSFHKEQGRKRKWPTTCYIHSHVCTM